MPVFPVYGKLAGKFLLGGSRFSVCRMIRTVRESPFYETIYRWCGVCEVFCLSEAWRGSEEKKLNDQKLTYNKISKLAVGGQQWKSLWWVSYLPPGYKEK